jgi:hypothetical protein
MRGAGEAVSKFPGMGSSAQLTQSQAKIIPKDITNWWGSISGAFNMTNFTLPAAQIAA